MLELLFLLPPIAATYGWYMRRKCIQQRPNRLSRGGHIAEISFFII
ncbi:hypothetical protein A35E_00235 [secondary endosymbiont of Heteropsylla cubana]|uniref:Uncharacterized protein n=1 Tax=secondary endosymbiont of Heteropsylla cubana TaxID=134287 RepID=J3Z5D8_9ENTR|nr:hypothetical protein A35E_00235 [secondary endosymbiont of Heteropsylla cubana]